MKYKRFALILALALCLWIPSAFAQTYTAGSYFTVTYDSDVYTLDDVTYESENTSDDSHWFFILYNDEIMFDVSMVKLEEYESLSLTTADDTAKQSYIDDTLDYYSDENATLLTSLAAGTKSIPFYVYSFQNEDGPYLMAETVQKGYAIDFMAYYNDASVPVDDALAKELSTLLGTFEPVM
ncbi:MAG: hypothetical protein PHI98_03845 [Eubacteriales bacterium]|nr:hypothetical protein [Eubacteriales bacterium]